MADLPDVRSDGLPERWVPSRPPYDRDHRSRTRRPLRGPWAVLRQRWASSDNRPVDLWRRLRCRTGHHDFRGGEHVQLGSRFVYVERRCLWCDAAPML